MKKFLVLISLFATGVGAFAVNFYNTPSSAQSGVAYSVNATHTQYLSSPGGISVTVLKNGAYVAGNGGGGTGSITVNVPYTSTDTGSQTVNYTASASTPSGTYTASASVYIIVPNSPPTITWTNAPASAYVNQWFNVQARGNDVDGNLATVYVWRDEQPFAFNGGGNGFEGYSDNNAAVSSTPGTVTFKARSTDSAGLDSGYITYSVSIVNRAPYNPTVSTGGVTQINLGQSLSISGTLSDDDGNLAYHNLWAMPPGGSWTELLSGSPSGAAYSSLSTSYTPNALGSWQFHSNGHDNYAWGPGATTSVNVVDGTAPGAPSGLSAGSVIPTSFTLSWNASSDNVGATGYEVFRDGASVGTTASTSLGISGLTQGTTYAMTVRATDAAGNWSGLSTALPVGTPRANQAAYVSQSVPSTLQAGATTSVSVTMNNSGWSTWNADATPHGLGSQNPMDNGVWGLGRVGLGGSSISPGQNNTFTFNITAPSTPGTYNFQWKMVEDGVEWFGATTPNVAISVPAQDNPSLTVQILNSTGAVLPLNGSGQAIVKLGDQVRIKLIASSPASAVSILYWRLTKPGGVQGSAPSAEWNWDGGSSWIGQTSTSGNPTWTSQLFTADTAGTWDIWYHANTASALPWGSQGPWTGNNFGWVTVGLPDLLVDGTAPSVPTSLVAANVQATSFTLNWAASSDNVGVTGYEVFRDGTSIGTPTATTFNVTGLTQGMTYAMTVRARDAAGNWSAPSAVRNVQTTDTEAPTIPTGLNATAITGSSFTLNWMASTDNVGVTGYEVMRDTTSLGTTASTSMAVTGLNQTTIYGMKVRAQDLAGNWSAWSNVMISDRGTPSIPTGLSVTGNTTGTSFTLNWNASTDNVGVTAYEVKKGGVSLGAAAGTTRAITGLTEITTYTMAVRAWDAAGNSSDWSSLDVKTADVTPPTIPGLPYATNVTLNSFTLNWGASSDNVAVTGYEVFRDNISQGTTASLLQNQIGLVPNTQYAMTVRACDAAGHWSDPTAPCYVTTNANQPPTVNLTAPVNGATFPAPAAFTLTATASDTDGSVTKVEFLRDGTVIGEALTAPYSLATTMAYPGTYAYTARATDNLGASRTTAANSVIVTAPVATIPFQTGFETADSYVSGALDGQSGWTATGASVVTNTSFATGAQSALLPGNATPATLTRTFPDATNLVIFADVFWKLRAGTDEATSPKFSVLNAAQVALVQSGTTGLVRVFNGDGSGGGAWQETPASVALDANGVTTAWVRVTLRLDYAAHKWDLYVNGVPAAINVNFASDTQSTIGSWTFTGHASASTYVDEVRADFENYIFVDIDRDGMPDSWETAHGLDPAVNDRDADLDGDGVSNIMEYFHGTDPNKADSDDDGLSDGQEDLAHTNPLLADTDGDGMPDWWELAHGLNPRYAGDATDDPDHDGVSNLQEFLNGSDPNYRLDGIAKPDGYEAVLLLPAGQFQGLKTTDWTLTPLPNP